MAEADFGIAIGIDRYQSLDRLSGAVTDAQKFHRWMLEGGKVPEEHTALITSPPRGRRGKPVHDQIDEELSRLIDLTAGRRARRLYVYFAGHGCSAEESHVNLILANASRELMNRGLDAPSYHKALTEGRWFSEHVCFYDCCRTEDPRARGLPPGFTIADVKSAKGADGAQGIRAGTNRQITQYVLYPVLFGHQSAERRDGTREQAGGIFTSALLDGLDGWAAIRAPADPARFVVTIATLTEYIKAQLRKAARDGPLQEPSGDKVGTTRPIILVEDATPRLRQITVHCPPSATDVRFLDHHFHERQRRVVVDCVAVGELPLGLHTAELVPSERKLTFQVADDQPEELDMSREP